jgi:hypothetical protein
VANLHDGCATRELLRLAVDVEISSRNGFILRPAGNGMPSTSAKRA